MTAAHTRAFLHGSKPAGSNRQTAISNNAIIVWLCVATNPALALLTQRFAALNAPAQMRIALPQLYHCAKFAVTQSTTRKRLTMHALQYTKVG
jgi:hypothetical protein